MEIVIGQIVRSRAGRDKNRFYAVVGIAGDSILLSNGDSRPQTKPKLKKQRHVTVTKKILCEGVLATDQQLKAAIAEYESALVAASQGG